MSEETVTPRTARGGTAAGGSGRWRFVNAAETADFARDVLFSADRKRPVVAITTLRQTGLPPVSPDVLSLRLEGLGEVVVFETGDSTWALSEALPPRLDVYGGAVRVWWPDLTPVADPYEHPLLFLPPAFEEAQVVEWIAAILRRPRHAPVPPCPRKIAPAAEDRLPSSADAREPLRGESPVPCSVTKTGRRILEATVTVAEAGRILIVADGKPGRVLFADEKLESLASRLTPGQRIPVFEVGPDASGSPVYSVQGLMRAASPAVPPVATVRAPNRVISRDAWTRIADHYRPGQVVRGRICRIEKSFVLVEVLPGVVLCRPLRRSTS